MLSIKPELARHHPLALFKNDPRHLGTEGVVVGFSGSFDHGGILTDLTPKTGKAIIENGTKIGADAVLRSGSLGAAGLNRTDNASFANAMLSAIDKVSALTNEASDLSTQAITDPESVDITDLMIAQVKAKESLDAARSILSRLTQAWNSLVNTR